MKYDRSNAKGKRGLDDILDEINKRLRDDLAARAAGSEDNSLNDSQAARKLHRSKKILNKAYKLMTRECFDVVTIAKSIRKLENLS